MHRGTATPIFLIFASLASASAAPAAENQGYLYGTVETTSGQKYTGFLRWDDEEAFWDDLYNASKDNRPYAEKLDRQGKSGGKKRIEFFGLPITVDRDFDSSRQFMVRFGELEEIRPGKGDRLTLLFKGGKSLELEEGSNDQSDDIVVLDAALGKIEVDSDRVARIRFAAAPAGATPPAARLWGKVKTRSGDFEGFIQWDSQEALATDKLDGEGPDGKLALDMGRLRSIARLSRKSAEVELFDGRKIELSGTNDVDDSIRGIVVETEKVGRIEIPWKEFVRVDFATGKGSGRGYADYGAPRALSGKVTLRDGRVESGRLVFDLDEELSAEMLNGDRDGIEYNIPFALIRSIEPEGDAASKVVLATGVELLLEDSADVDEDNAGVMILSAGGRETYVSWNEVRRIDFD